MRVSERKFRLDRATHHMFELEAELLTDMEHPGIFRQNIGHDPAEPFFPTDRDEAAQQLSAQPAALEIVAHEQRKLCRVGVVQLHQTADCADNVQARGGIGVVGDERDLAIVIDATDPLQPLVIYPLA